MRKRTWKEVSGPGVNLTQSQEAVGDRDTDCGESVYLVLCQEHLTRFSQQNWEEVDVAVITHSLQMRQLGNREGK